ncbi:hypothetical protein [Gemmatimonas sp.]|uniref:hypothetical protein n=1 Tax=Gemmatimonas sp. TaxID=1962908 RepID=UPI003982E295
MSFARVNLPALVALWARQVDDLAREIDRIDPDGADMRERVAVRHEIAQRLRIRPASAETRDLLHEFDDAFRAVTAESLTCAYGDDRAAAEGWTRQREWYFWRRVSARRIRQDAPRSVGEHHPHELGEPCIGSQAP